MTSKEEDRKSVIDNLSSVIDKAREHVSGILNKLHWSEEQVLVSAIWASGPIQ